MDKAYQNLLRITEQFMRGRSFKALTEKEIAEKLDIVEKHRPMLRKVLAELVKKGVTKASRGRYHTQKQVEDLVSGSIHVHTRGFGFVNDVFIPKHLTMNAVQGDKVEVLINPESTSDKGPEGRVVAILERGRTHISGIIKQNEGRNLYTAYAPMLGTTQRVVVEAEDVVNYGDRVVMEVLDWGARDTETRCRLSHVIGHIDDASVDIQAAIEAYELRSSFPHDVLVEAKAFGNKVSQTEIDNREDLRDVTCVTIDPDTAKDFDDAISLTKDKMGYQLGVHIADVTHYVLPQSALEREAIARSNSTYFPGTCIPMLPEELSNNLCSLKPRVNRLTISVLMDLDKKGNMRNYRIVRGVIKSAKRFTYKEAKQVLDGEKKSPHTSLLKLMVELCGQLKEQRYQRGSIEFAIPELVVHVDDKGVPTGTEIVSYDITHQMIEEFMLKANETVARHLSDKGRAIAYRVHEEPQETSLQDFADLARSFGFNLPEQPKPKDFQQFFDEALDTPYGQYLATSYIRCMQQADYRPENIGHYGLSLTHYCHFTSPIRRYPDVIVHRALFNEVLPEENLEALAEQCSDQERVSAKAENHVRLLKKLRLLKSYAKKEPHRTYEAVITKVKNFGLYFEVLDLMLEAFVHISEIGDDYYVFDEGTNEMVGRRSDETFFAGDTIEVALSEVDLVMLESKWHIVR